MISSSWHTSGIQARNASNVFLEDVLLIQTHQPIGVKKYGVANR